MMLKFKSVLADVPIVDSGTLKQLRGDSSKSELRVPLGIENMMIVIEPRDNQIPRVTVHAQLDVDEGGSEILSPDILSVEDGDTRLNNLTVILVTGPLFGYLEVRDETGNSIHRGSLFNIF